MNIYWYFIQQRQVMNQGTYDDILTLLTPRDRNIKLMQHLMTCGTDAYELFKNILKLKYDFVFREMEKMESCEKIAFIFLSWCIEKRCKQDWATASLFQLPQASLTGNFGHKWGNICTSEWPTYKISLLSMVSSVYLHIWEIRQHGSQCGCCHSL